MYQFCKGKWAKVEKQAVTGKCLDKELQEISFYFSLSEITISNTYTIKDSNTFTLQFPVI